MNTKGGHQKEVLQKKLSIWRNTRPIMMRRAESNLYISQMNIVKTNTYYLSGVDDIYAMKSGGVFLYLTEPRSDLLVAGH